jgi:hypothetical protein
LGFVGSLHCAGMCGPLAAALPGCAPAAQGFISGRVAYKGGRITTYCALGALFGTVGRGFLLAGVQQSLSIGAGAAILIGLLVVRWRNPSAGLTRPVQWVKAALAQRIARRGNPALFVFGLLNGLLPCGLVYAACAGAAATGSVPAGMGYMAAFGLGTVPMMVSASMAGSVIPVRLRLRLQGWVPLFLAMMGLVLILRGMSLGIPYLSPDLSSGHATCPACH